MIASKTLEMNSLCEMDNCQKIGELITHYCIICNKHLCSKCSNTHNQDHKIVDLDKIINPSMKEKINKDIQEFNSQDEKAQNQNRDSSHEFLIQDQDAEKKREFQRLRR